MKLKEIMETNEYKDYLLGIDKADLLNSDADVLGNAYEYLIGQFASETDKKAGEFYAPQAVSKILTKITIAGQEAKKGLSVYKSKVQSMMQSSDCLAA